MFAFIIIILLCVLALGVSLFVGHWNKSKKSGAEFSVVAFYNKDWRSLFWIFLRVLSFALVTVILFLMVIATFGEDDAGECFFWIIMFVVGSWFISIPILVIYICSAVQAIRHRDYKNKVFLGCHCFNVLQLLCVVILSSQLLVVCMNNCYFIFFSFASIIRNSYLCSQSIVFQKDNHFFKTYINNL